MSHHQHHEQEHHKGMSTGKKVALGVGVAAVGAVAVGAVAAVGLGVGYCAYKSHKGHVQNKSPMQLHIRFIGAKNLKNLEMFGKSDPYAQAELDQVKVKTKTISNNLNPVWEQVLQMGVQQKHLQKNANVEFEVYDDDLGRDKNMGKVFLPINSIPWNTPQFFDLGFKHGSLQIEAWMTNTGAPAEVVAAADAATREVGAEALRDPEEEAAIAAAQGYQQGYPQQAYPQQAYPGYPPAGGSPAYPGYPPAGGSPAYPGYPPQQGYPGYPPQGGYPGYQ